VLLHFLGSKCTISRFHERSRDGQYSLVSFLFAVLLLTVRTCPAICKSCRHVLPVPNKVGTAVCTVGGRAFLVSAARVSNGLTVGTRHIVTIVTRLQRAFEDSPLLQFPAAASQ